MNENATSHYNSFTKRNKIPVTFRVCRPHAQFKVRILLEAQSVLSTIVDGFLRKILTSSESSYLEHLARM